MPENIDVLARRATREMVRVAAGQRPNGGRKPAGARSPAGHRGGGRSRRRHGRPAAQAARGLLVKLRRRYKHAAQAKEGVALVA